MASNVVVFDLATPGGTREYAEMRADPSVRVVKESDFFAMSGGGPDNPPAPFVIRVVDVDVAHNAPAVYVPPIC